MSRRLVLAAASAVLSLALAACGSPGQPGSDAGGSAASSSGSPLRVGLVYSKSGPLGTYGQQYRQGFTAGLDYATKGTNAVDGRPVEVTEQDDAGDPAKAVAAATDLIGQGVKVLAGSTSSGVALQVAPLAQDNKVLFVSGPAAVDAVTGANRYTFRSGRQTYQDVATAGTMIGDVTGKKIGLAQSSRCSLGWTRRGTTTDRFRTNRGMGLPLLLALVPPENPKMIPLAIKVGPQMPDRGPPRATPAAVLAAASGMARNFLFLGRMVTWLPAGPIWVQAYSAPKDRPPVTLLPSIFTGRGRVDRARVPLRRPRRSEVVPPVRCRIITCCQSRTECSLTTCTTLGDRSLMIWSRVMTGFLAMRSYPIPIQYRLD